MTNWPRSSAPRSKEAASRQGFLKQLSALFSGQLFKLVLQAVYFVLLARVLGVQSFGTFAAVAAIAAICAPFINLGATIVMAKAVARDVSRSSCEWTRTLVYTLLGGSFLTVVALIFVPQFLVGEISALAVGAIVFADIVAVKLIENVGYLYQARGSVAYMAILPSLMNAFRVLAVSALYLFYPNPSLQTWAVLYLAATVPLAIILSVSVTRSIGFDTSGLRLRRKVALEGLQYALGLSAQSVHNDIDKTLLASIGSATSAGLYSAAYRIVDMAYAPIRAVAAASFPRLNRAGERGLPGSMPLVKKLALPVLAYSAVATVLLFVSAPAAPIVLGAEFSETTEAIRLLSFLIFLRAISFLAGDALTTSDHQGLRTIVQIVIGVLNIGANLVLIPIYGINGAIIATLCSELLLAVFFWVIVYRLLRKKTVEAAPRLAKEPL